MLEHTIQAEIMDINSFFYQIKKVLYAHSGLIDILVYHYERGRKVATENKTAKATVLPVIVIV